jgi:hypothetical protein
MRAVLNGLRAQPLPEPTHVRLDDAPAREFISSTLLDNALRRAQDQMPAVLKVLAVPHARRPRPKSSRCSCSSVHGAVAAFAASSSASFSSCRGGSSSDGSCPVSASDVDGSALLPLLHNLHLGELLTDSGDALGTFDDAVAAVVAAEE